MRLVLLHALPFDERMWELVGPVPGDAFAPKLYGFGDSIEEWAAALVAQCRDNELLVVGCSVGGSCALEVARAAPDQVRTVMLVGAKADVRPDPAACSEAVGLLRIQGVEAAWNRYWAPAFGPHADAATVAVARRLALEQSVEDLIAGVRAFHERRDNSEFAKSWRGKLCLVNGSHDQTPTPQVAAASVHGAQRVEQVIVNDCGHFVPLEQPVAFWRLVADQLGQC